MFHATCHCSAIRIAVPAPPEAVTDCNCSICRRYGALWAYYPRAEIALPAGGTEAYVWGDRKLEFHRCVTCGCVTHWQAVDPTRFRVGINARLMPPEVLAAARVRRLDGADSWEYLEERADPGM
jgi:hypothetical protein